MQRLFAYLLLIALACPVAGIYGALHDQVTFSIAPEYYFKLKFSQFAIPTHLHGRVGAAWVGWCASWWMGLVIGYPLCSLAFLTVSGARTFVKTCLKSFAIAVAVTAAASALALLRSSGAQPYLTFPISGCPPDVEDKVAFARVATIHMESYVGGAVGLAVASVYILVTVLTTPMRSLIRRMSDEPL